MVGEPASSLTIELSGTWPLSTLLMSSDAIGNAKSLYANSQYARRVQYAEPAAEIALLPDVTTNPSWIYVDVSATTKNRHLDDHGLGAARK